MQCKGIPSRGRGLGNNNEFVGRWFVGGRRFSRGLFVGGLRLGCVGSDSVPSYKCLSQFSKNGKNKNAGTVLFPLVLTVQKGGTM